MFVFGIFIWLTPLILLTGINDFFGIAWNQTNGHFNDFGGTIISNNNFTDRGIHFFRSIWADGMGGYSQGRTIFSLMISSLLSFFLNDSIMANLVLGFAFFPVFASMTIIFILSATLKGLALKVFAVFFMNSLKTGIAVFEPVSNLPKLLGLS